MPDHAGFLEAASRPVRAILFDSTADTNSTLAGNQDRTMCVKRRIDVNGFGSWTTKQGMQHVAPPFELLSRIAKLRVHLDDAPATNARCCRHLLAQRGLVPVDAVAEVFRPMRYIYLCLDDAEDV